MGAIAGVGRWCFRHRWWVLLIWVLAVGAGGASAGAVFDRLVGDNNPRGVESIEAFDVLGAGNESGGTVVALVDGVDAASAPVRNVVSLFAEDLRTDPAVKEVAHPFDGSPAAPAMIARDGRALLISVVLKPAEDDRVKGETIDGLTGRLDGIAAKLRAAGQPDAKIKVGGNTVLNREVNQTVQVDLQRAEIISLPVTLLVLVVVFGGLVAAGLPVLTAAFSVAAAMTVLLGFSYLTDLDQNVVTVVTLMGLGLSIDYGLLLVARFREERGAGFDPEEATARAWATAGRTIMFSALTVAAALAGLLMFDISALAALGAAGVSIALMAMVTSLTFTAALLAFARNRIKPAAASKDSDDHGFFARLSGFVQRRPWPVALLTAAALIAMGLPLLTATVILPQLEGLPDDLESVQVEHARTARFGLESAPTVLVVARTTPEQLTAWAGRWSTDAAVAEVRPARATGHDISQVQLVLRGGAQDEAAQALVERVRDDRPPGESWVTGDAAILVDLMDLIYDGLPWAVGVTLLAMVLLLFAFTGSVVVPIKAILANVISLGSTFGVLVAVFEYGYGEDVLHTLTIGGLSPFIVVIVFAFAFGLSMDYEVFLLGRIKEYVERGVDSDTAVRRGLQHTGRIITSAALLMVVVFACFAGARVGQIEEVGLGLTVAVLIDATIVRCLLVPATMTLLGRWNWWAPAPLRRLHEKFGLREATLPEPGAERAPVDLVKAGDPRD
ncbi:putative membrane protein [Virgisporangium aliadipatigenens]|uniref:Putative membrane protein n=1 Tax=Virgisporangium aliadipatigenens TaxID=741659 RepID=A0A8J3YWI4_9ACTN|nr:putative membrane protein [Virgisporangium aliadipatigenens]